MIFQKLCIGRVNQIKFRQYFNGITAYDRQHVHLSKTIAKAMEAGRESIDQPSLRLIQRASPRQPARAGKSVFLATDMPSITYIR